MKGFYNFLFLSLVERKIEMISQLIRITGMGLLLNVDTLHNSEFTPKNKVVLVPFHSLVFKGCGSLSELLAGNYSLCKNWYLPLSSPLLLGFGQSIALIFGQKYAQ